MTYKANKIVLGKRWTINEFENEFKDHIDLNILFCRAAFNGYTNRVKELLETQLVDPSYSDNYAIIHACVNKHYDTVKILISDYRVDVSVFCDWVLRDAAWNGDVKMVELLLSKYSDEIRNNVSMIVKDGHIKIIDVLVEKKYQICL